MAEKKNKPETDAKPEAVGRVPRRPRHVVGGGVTDSVYLSQAVENKLARKSLTVHHVQRALAEAGYPDAAADRDGYYGVLTQAAVTAFQEDKGFEGHGVMNAETFKALFKGDPNVTVILE